MIGNNPVTRKAVIYARAHSLPTSVNKSTYVRKKKGDDLVNNVSKLLLDIDSEFKEASNRTEMALIPINKFLNELSGSSHSISFDFT